MKGTARLIGAALFLAGVAIIFAVFFMAWTLYYTPIIGGNPSDALLDRLGEAVVKVLGRVLLLIVMSVCGALIASKGVQLYLATLAPPPPGDAHRNAAKRRPPDDG